MITAYAVADEKLVAHEMAPGAPLPAGAVWLDLHDPSAEEDSQAEGLSGVSIPTRDEMREIEESSRFYAEGGALYLTAPVLHSTGTDSPGIAPVTFVVAGALLVTVRHTAPTPFAMYKARAARPGSNLVTGKCEPLTVLLGLVESITDRLADVLESVSQRLDAESTRMITGSGGKKPMSTLDFRRGLQAIGREGEFLSRARESLAGLARMIVYLQANQDPKGKSVQKAWLKSLERDVQSLSGHAGFLSERTTFLLDTVVGLVSVEQSAIIKIFSVVAVIFLPPTLVASVYGMNFEFMPELSWLLGYPWALGLMVLSAIVPLLYFRRRGWL